MHVIYTRLILNYFTSYNISEATYFDTKIRALDVAAQRLHDTLKLYEKLYQIHIFTMGEMSWNRFIQCAEIVRRAFETHVICQEGMLAQKWDVILKSVHSGQTGYWMTLLNILDTMRQQFTAIPTAYEHRLLSSQPGRAKNRFNQRVRITDDAPTTIAVHATNTTATNNNAQPQQSQVTNSSSNTSTTPQVPASAGNSSKNTTPTVPCPCGKAGHIKENCSNPLDWYVSKKDVERVIYQMTSPGYHHF